jgi:hypothetical protein
MLVLYRTITVTQNSATNKGHVVNTSSDVNDDLTEGVETDGNSSEGAKQKREPSPWTSNEHTTARTTMSNSLAAHSLKQVQ